MFELQKLKRYTEDARKRRYEDLKSLFPFEGAKDRTHSDTVHNQCPAFEPEFEVDQFYHFEGRDEYLFLRKTFAVPEARAARSIVGIFDFGITGGGNNNGFEAVLYVNGKLYQGVDSNHQEVFLDEFAGQEITLTFILWTGINEGRMEPLHHMLAQADIGYLILEADQFYYLSRAAAETAVFLPETDVCRYELIRILENTYQRIIWEKEYYLESVAKANTYLEKELSAIKNENPYTIHCIGHTHIDVAWLWRLKHTHEKALRSFSTVMRNMERYDDYYFIQSQPQLYDFIRQDDPQLYEEMRQRIAQDRWITDGGMWLEADCNITSGESLSRQLLYGTRYFEKEYGKKCRILWLPDVFGYSWALPQILKECGIDYFVTTKISWNQVNSMPHDLFIWKGIDGTEITTYFINTPEEGQPEDRWYATYNGFLSPETVLGTVKRFKDKEYGRDMLISFGYGDGGGGPSREMIEMQRAMKKIPGLPNIETGSVTKFLDQAKDQLEAGNHKPMWDGELYLEYHRGTYTSQAFNKKMNRKTEFAMGEAEFLSTLAMQEGAAYPQDSIDECWKTILRNQFHDIIPGSSIHEVYEDSAKEYAKVLSAIEKMKVMAEMTLLEEKENSISYYHTGSFTREDLLYLPVSRENVCITDAAGKELEYQKVRNGYAVKVEAKPYTLHSLYWKKEEQEIRYQSSFEVNLEQRMIQTPHYQILWNEKGSLISIYDKDYERELLKEGAVANQLVVFEDRPMNYENWDIDCYYEEKKDYFCLKQPVEVLEEGLLLVKLQFVLEYHDSVIRQNMILYRDSRRIDFETNVEWKEDHRLLKAVFPVDIRTTKASYDIQYGYVERPVHKNTSWDEARFESVGQKWADLSETDYGVSILNDCKYGYGINENIMSISLLKSTKYPDIRMDLGEHSFTYSLLPHAGNVVAGDTIEESIILNQPLQSMTGSSKHQYLVKLTAKDGTEQKNVVIDAIKKAQDDDAVILRMHECRGGRASVYLQTSQDVKAEYCTITEKAKGVEADLTKPVSFRPFEIINLRLQLR